jgi:hypothetical protein
VNERCSQADFDFFCVAQQFIWNHGAAIRPSSVWLGIMPASD